MELDGFAVLLQRLAFFLVLRFTLQKRRLRGLQFVRQVLHAPVLLLLRGLQRHNFLGQGVFLDFELFYLYVVVQHLGLKNCDVGLGLVVLIFRLPHLLRCE